jgi:hypothetical protein
MTSYKKITGFFAVAFQKEVALYWPIFPAIGLHFHITQPMG